MDNRNIYVTIGRYILIIGPILSGLYMMPGSSYPGYIIFSLLILINSQVRAAYLKNRMILVSLIFECLFLLYMSCLYGGYVYLIFFVHLIDACLLLKDEVYPFLIFIAICLIFSVYREYSIEWTALTISFYIIFMLLLMGIRRELLKRVDTESLYDQISRYTYELETARIRLLDYSKQVEKVAQLEERNRISREIHDSIGHNLTGVLMQVDACIEIMKVDSEKGMEILKSIYTNINAGIETLRDTVRRIKPVEYQTNIDAMNMLVKKFIEDTGINVEIKSEGVPYEMSPSIVTVLYHNIREALTNSARHGQCKNIWIKFFYRADYIEVFIQDDGKGVPRINKGFGLAGIEERLNLLGGTVSFSGNNGFNIHMLIPNGGE